mmetsp:Transcript_16776/g.45493  ORF Transcript_16776/g.45493 Transcript_16776/m.45493 type:complete len:317 (+) Transcript_16776:1206-2156(+)
MRSPSGTQLRQKIWLVGSEATHTRPWRTTRLAALWLVTWRGQTRSRSSDSGRQLSAASTLTAQQTPLLSAPKLLPSPWSPRRSSASASASATATFRSVITAMGAAATTTCSVLSSLRHAGLPCSTRPAAARVSSTTARPPVARTRPNSASASSSRAGPALLRLPHGKSVTMTSMQPMRSGSVATSHRHAATRPLAHARATRPHLYAALRVISPHSAKPASKREAASAGIAPDPAIGSSTNSLGWMAAASSSPYDALERSRCSSCAPPPPPARVFVVSVGIVSSGKNVLPLAIQPGVSGSATSTEEGSQSAQTSMSK